jgi:hypothetical protein
VVVADGYGYDVNVECSHSAVVVVCVCVCVYVCVFKIEEMESMDGVVVADGWV